MNANDSAHARILIFAKAPVPGHCKTRLATGIGTRRAAAVYRRLLRRTVATATAAGAAPVTLLCAPDTRHPFFAALRRDHGVALARQPRGNLGRRMHAALKAALADSEAAVLVGGDCPVLSAEHFAEAIRQLNGRRRTAVFAPAEDGGYALVGLRSEAPWRLFQGVTWGSSAVMRQTRRRVSELRLPAAYLDPVWDVDVPADFRRARHARLI